MTAKNLFRICLAFLCAVHAQEPLFATEELKLKGNIEHSQSLPAVEPDGLDVGKKFDERKFRSHHHAGSTLWWRVPDWLVGVWQNVGRTRQISLKNLQTEQDFGAENKPISYPDEEIIGFQKDRKGDVWTTVPTPYFTRTRIGHVKNLHRVMLVEALQTNKQQVVLRLVATTYSVDSHSDKILSISQRESLQTYRPVEDGKIIVLSSIKFFDDKGKAKYASNLLTHSRRHAGFTELQYWSGPGTGLSIIDLRKSFDEYLHQEKLDELIPIRKFAHS